MPGVSLTVIAPELDVHWTGTAGYDSEEKDRVMTADQPFRIASVTKTFVAAAMLRLHETGRLHLDVECSVCWNFGVPFFGQHKKCTHTS